MLYATVAALAASLIFFIWVALRERRPSTSLDDYLTARGSQGATTLGLSFLASGLGGQNVTWRARPECCASYPEVIRIIIVIIISMPGGRTKY